MADQLTIADRLARAEASCARRGARLTKLRRDVLELVLSAKEPVGAYALLDGLRSRNGAGKPPTVYRALDFLLAQGLIHRLERLGAFVGCHDDGAGHAHAAQFLICRGCRRVTELEDGAAEAAVLDAARRAGFLIERAVVELEGLCTACAADDTGAQAGSALPG